MLGSVLKALEGEKVLKSADIEVSLLVPPVELRTGCDLALAVFDYQILAARNALEAAGLVITDHRDSLVGTAKLSDVVTHEYFSGTDGNEYLMVRAGNMKITVRTHDGLIVNTSGGGCPDIPYLNLELVGKTTDRAPRPKALGKTLCGLMLDRAFMEATRMMAVSDASARNVEVSQRGGVAHVASCRGNDPLPSR